MNKNFHTVIIMLMCFCGAIKALDQAAVSFDDPEALDAAAAWSVDCPQQKMIQKKG